ncbi:hypothetical protein [Escherichia coli]|uniref:hypothetical protein n=1 Tax=Escherichia coli TaxID=562 RepID=UPI002023EF59|nr:hypothetical protein [Escherichia coli]
MCICFDFFCFFFLWLEDPVRRMRCDGYWWEWTVGWSTLMAGCLARGVAFGVVVWVLLGLRVPFSRVRDERKRKGLENQLSPATDVAVAPHSSASKE